MLWRPSARRHFLYPLTGCLLALMVLELLHNVIPDNSRFGLFETAFAVQATIDNAVSTTQTEHDILGQSSVFISDQVGYKFYTDSTGTCVYSKTTNGGANWGLAVIIDSQTDCFSPVVWYDRWTPGDGGTYIHILTADSGNDHIWYNRLDTTDDSRLLNAAPVSVAVDTGQTGTIAGGTNAGSITKATDGTIYMSMNDNTDSYVVFCTTSCETASSWDETSSNPMDAQPDWTLLMPLPDGDILLINRDISADDMRSKVWDVSGNIWSATWTAINANAIENSTYDPAFAAIVNTTSSDVKLAYVDNATAGTLGGANDDVKTATYSGGAWTGNTDVVTNSALGLTKVAIGINGVNNDVYVTYGGQTTAGVRRRANVYWASSTAAMGTWSPQRGPINTTADDLYGIDLNGFSYDRLFASWYATSSDDIFGDTIINPTPVTAVGTRGLQETEVRASTTDFYVGGMFTVVETVTSRNVTSVTLAENGTVNAALGLDNIELRYDLDTSAPYDCASESYAGGETQYGSTDTDGFSGSDGTSTFTGSVAVTPTQALCAYVIVDVTKSAAENSLIEIEIDNPAADVVLSAGTAVPNYPILLSGNTNVKLDSDFRIQRGVSTITGDTLTLTAGVDYDQPVASTSAFLRITNTQLTGAGRNSGGGTSNADDTTVYITNPSNIMNSITFARGTAAADNTRVAWEIIEYKGVAGGENEMIVRRQQPVTYVSGNTTLTAGAASGVADDADIAVFITGQYNPNTAAASYHLGISTAAWNAGTDQAVFTRGASGNTSALSYAAVEFTGSNWRVQRAEHTYAAVGTTETQAITAVNSLSRAFIHVQKRIPSSSHANFGHEVWFSGLGQLSFLLNATAVTPASHRSVAWVIENTQTNGSPMDVTRSNGTFTNTGAAPQANNIAIGKTLNDLSVASLFTNNRSDTTGNTWPEPIMAARLISTTQYELWRSDTGANIAYRTEVVEWPTAARSLEQDYYRLYVNNNALLPTDPWPAGATDLGENTEMTADDGPIAIGEEVRIRMSVRVEGAAMPAGSDDFVLQFAPRVTTCTAATAWNSLGDAASSTALWRTVNNAPAAGTALSTDPPTGGDLVLSVSTVSGTYEEANSSAVNPYIAYPNDVVEYDWTVEHNGAEDKTDYCFRLVENGGALLSAYNFYPVVRTVGYEPLVTNWRWYDDETSATPSSPRAGENVSASNIENQNALKLRLVLRESSGADGINVKFALQFSEYADFSQGVVTLTSTSTCTANSLWCYYDGAGVDNAGITTAVISDADTCSGGVGAGCGTYNEGTSTVSATYDQVAFTSTEYEFTLLQAGARVNRVYYFRLYNLTYDEVVGVANTFSHPSLVTEGALMTFSINGLNSQTSTAGIVTDATTTSAAIPFGTLPFSTDIEAAQRLSIDTNATEGYQVLAFGSQQLLNSYGEPIPDITATNASPAGWNTSCLLAANGCFGYHTTDATLDGGSSRFGAVDSYAAIETVPREIMYSSIPTIDTEDVIYRIKVNPGQTAGDYVTDIVYIAVPVH